MPNLDTRRERLFFWLTAFVLLFAGLGLRDPWPADEPRFALVARQMVESGQWLFPMRGDELYPDKPPLLMWLQAVFLSTTGSLRLSFLLPTLLASLGTLALVRDLGRRLWNAEAGAYASWALLFALQFTFQAKRAQIDPLVVFWITLSVYGLLRHLLRGPAAAWWYLGWAAAGLGVISKGVGVVALLVLLPAAFAWGRRWPGIGRVRGREWLGGVAMLLLPVLLWLAPMLLAVKASGDPLMQGYADNILLKQTAQRYANAWHHHQPWYYFLVVMATQWLPAVAAVPFVAPRWREALKARDARVLLPLGGVALIVLFFSLSSGKREVYILPALPLLCLAMGPWLGDVVGRRGVRAGAFVAAVLFALSLLVAGLAVVLGQPGFEARLAAIRGTVDGDALGAMLAVIGGVGLFAALALRPKRGVAALHAVIAALWLGYSFIGYPLLNDASSARGLMRASGERIGPDAELALVAWKEQNLLMADRPARTFGFKRDNAGQLRDARAWQAERPQTRWLLIEDDALDDCIDDSHAIDMGVYNRRRWLLLPAAATRPGCVPTPGSAAPGELTE
ncbi:glycosyltransferase family 39 protein [Lysobacter pythonis]|uniref:Glycosyltransferase family 39 protein n=1 Tax=Solilutibacter pythonis TaxID=2483112 RepID=A0A3M2HSF1_9GAMM|nr:glycosyltransferase family 39 protein [Lysobacter pythonis]